MEIDDPLRQREAEPGALRARPRRATAPLERLEDAVLLLLGDADARVPHADLRPVAGPPGLDRHRPSVGRELHRIGEQVQDHLLELAFIGLRHAEARLDVARERDRVAGGALANHRDAVLDQVRQEDRFEVDLHLARLDLRQIENLVDQLEQMAPRVADVTDVLVLSLVELAEHPIEQDIREADDRVQRRPQLVRHAGEELRLVPAGHLHLACLVFELLEHPGVVDCHDRLAGERLEKVDGLLRQRSRDGTPDDERAEDHVLAPEWQHHHRAPPVGAERVDVWIGRLGVEIRRLAHLTRGGRAAHERPLQPDPDLSQRTDQFRRSCRRRFAARTPRRPRRTRISSRHPLPRARPHT